jgi:hypothetical protein
VRVAIRAGLIPTINCDGGRRDRLHPGMMTGQVLAGADPLAASFYQIVVMLMVSAATAIGSVLAVMLSYRRRFSADGVYLEKGYVGPSEAWGAARGGAIRAGCPGCSPEYYTWDACPRRTGTRPTRRPMTGFELYLKRNAKKFDAYLATFFDNGAHPDMRRYLYGPVARFTANAGKRHRPLICLLACEAVGGDPERAKPSAAAIEHFHTAALIHDDIEDSSLTRRDEPCMHVARGRAWRSTPATSRSRLSAAPSSTTTASMTPPSSACSPSSST